MKVCIPEIICSTLKGPKHEILNTEIFTQSEAVWVDDLKSTHGN
jgi:hypothetical protein